MKDMSKLSEVLKFNNQYLMIVLSIFTALHASKVSWSRAKKSMFWVTDLKSFGMEGTLFF